MAVLLSFAVAEAELVKPEGSVRLLKKKKKKKKKLLEAIAGGVIGGLLLCEFTDILPEEICNIGKEEEPDISPDISVDPAHRILKKKKKKKFIGGVVGGILGGYLLCEFTDVLPEEICEIGKDEEEDPDEPELSPDPPAPLNRRNLRA